MHAVRLIGQTVYDWDTFLPLTLQATGDRIAEESDTSPRSFTECEKIISALRRLVTGQSEYLLEHVSLTFLFAVDELDLDLVLNQLSGISVLVRDTRSRAVLLLATGTTAQWEARVKTYQSTFWDDVETELRRVCPLRVKRLT